MVRTGSNRKMILHLYLTNVVAVVWLLSGVWPLQLHGLQHTRLPCSSLSHGVFSYSCPLSQWCHPTISFSVIPFSSRLQSFLASGYFPMSWLFNSGGQSIGPSASVLPMNIQHWFALGLTGLIFLLSKGLSRIFSRPVNSKLSPSEHSFPWTRQEWQIGPFAPFS